MPDSRRRLLDTSSVGLLADLEAAKSWTRRPGPRWRLPMAGAVSVIENQWIPLADGERLAAQIWLPRTTCGQHPAPVVLEYIPYRKRWSGKTDGPGFSASTAMAITIGSEARSQKYWRK